MASTYLVRNTWGTATSDKIFTYSTWVKRSQLGSTERLFGAYAGSPQVYSCDLSFTSNNGYIEFVFGGASAYDIVTNAMFRDISAWYHVVLTTDTTQATASDRIKIYVNGTLQTLQTANYPPQNSTYQVFRNSNANLIGSAWNGGAYYNGSMASTYFIDGQALTPSSFGETDATTGIWKPKGYSGSYGTNGFFLKFESSGSLGTDSSGNGNNFTVNGTPTQTVDTPSNVFATLNALSNTGVTLSNGNLTTTYSTNDANVKSTFGMSSGKWYWEAKVLGTASGLLYGICLDTAKHQINIADDATVGIYGIQNAGTSFMYLDTNGTRASSAGFPNQVANNILNFALDRDNNKFYVGINGTYYSASGATGNPATGTNETWTLDSGYAGRTFMFILETRSSSENTNVNFGNGYFGSTAISSPYSDGAGFGKFQYQPPTGYYSLCTKNINIYG
jgi:hypothetical protein